MENCKSLVSFLLLGSLCCLLGGVSAQADSHIHAHHHQSDVQVKSFSAGAFTGVLLKSQLENATGDNRISGGVIANQNEYPWMVYLVMFKTSTSTDPYVCGGTLINNQWVMTAAICLDGFVKVDVYLGAHNLVASSEQYRVKYTSTNFIKHPNWRAGSTANNIGLIKLPSTISFTNQIKAIGLPSTGEGDHVGDTVYLAGWGAQTGSSSSLSQYLRKVTTTVMSNVECQSLYGTASVTGSDMCSRGTDLVGICSGDNGGPMMYQTNGNYIQLGVASFWYGSGQGCSSGYPSGFVRVSKYVDWIKSTSSATAFIAQSFNSILLTALTGIVLSLRNIF